MQQKVFDNSALFPIIAVFWYKFSHFVRNINQSYFIKMHDAGKGSAHLSDRCHVEDSLIAEERAGMWQLVVAVVSKGVVEDGVAAVGNS